MLRGQLAPGSFSAAATERTNARCSRSCARIVEETIDLYHADGKPLPPATAGRGSKYVAQAGPRPADPVLALRGVGRELWANEEVDVYVSRRREGCS